MKLLMIICVFCVTSLQLTAQATKKPATAAKPATAGKPATAAKQTQKPVAKKEIGTVPFKNSLDSFSYAVGLSLASFYKDQGVKEINSALVLRALNDVKNGKPQLSEEQINTCIMGYMQVAKSEKASPNKKQGQAFLAENKKKPGVITTASGLQYTVLKEGTGAKPTSTDQVKVHYTGTLLDGTIFDSSVKRGEPIVMGVNQFITGWIEALQMMPIGSKWKLFIPSELGYGDHGSGAITPGSTLIFEIELLDIVK